MDRIDDNQFLDEWCSRWAAWHRSRRLFAPPIPQNILARMRPQPVREAPDAILSADMSYFNLALLSLPESQGKEAFYLYYLHGARPVKMVAHEMKIDRSTFYKIMWDVRGRAYRAYRRMMVGSVLPELETKHAEHISD